MLSRCETCYGRDIDLNGRFDQLTRHMHDMKLERVVSKQAGSAVWRALL